MENIKTKSIPKKIGLALGGGGAKGLAHIGVIKALEDAGIKIDYIAGTSMGALVGGWYAATGDIDSLEDLFLKLKKRDIVPMSKIIRKKDGVLFRDQAIIQLLEGQVKNLKIEDCEIPFRAVATDVQNGDEVVIRKGSLVEAIKASTALPVIFNPVSLKVSLKDRLLMDGGFSNPVPADVVRNMGAEFVIAVDVSSEWHNISGESMNPIHFYTTIAHALSIVEYQLARRILEGADVVLRPAVLSFNWLAFGEAADIVREGEMELRRNLKEIRKKTGYPELPKTLFDKFFDFLSPL